MTIDKCPSCGVPWVDHLGMTGTCAKLQEAKRQIAELQRKHIERFDHVTALQARNSELVERNRLLERMLNLSKSDPMRMIMHEYYLAVDKHPKFAESHFQALSILMEEVGEVADALNEMTWGEGTKEHMDKELAQVGAVVLRWLTANLKGIL